MHLGATTAMLIVASVGCGNADDPSGDDDRSALAESALTVGDSAEIDPATVAARTIGVYGLGFENFHLGLDPRWLVDQYPMSRHRVTMATSGRGWSYIPGFDEDPPDLAGLWASYTSGSGTYILRVAPEEVTDGIYDVQFEFDPGRIIQMWLRFEVPVGLRGTIDGRSCASVMESLVEAHGPPTRELRPFWEETVLHELKLWLDERSELRWDCAEGAVILRRLAPEADGV